jgi:hypothetical protein
MFRMNKHELALSTSQAAIGDYKPLINTLGCSESLISIDLKSHRPDL